ncbi:MAG: DegT/DnrJ/EryC1/StrS family aminotransferase [Acidobacteria bacterium]|nr:DegT/DnrJ/EryC1/StrS family aminotransferase [Acidobacteriota bacterium]
MIPYSNLKAQYDTLAQDIDAAVRQVIESSQFVLGPAVAAFEQDFARYCDTAHAVGTSSGTSALHLALLACGVGPGDEVITVPFTFVATAAAIEYAGARPVFVDVDPVYYTMDPARVEAAITPRTKAIMPVHLYGQAADMDPLLDIARRHRLKVIEDACQAHGADYRGRRCGSIGDVACFSFYPGKNLGAFGEGGAAVTSDPGLADAMRARRSWGEHARYEHAMRGFNYRMDGLQGAVLGVKLRHLERWIEARRSRAAVYRRCLDGTGAVVPPERPDARHVDTVYVVRVAQRDAWTARLTEAGIETRVHYPTPIHLQPAYRDLGYHAGDFPVAEALAREVLSLPMFPELTEAQVETVADVFRSARAMARPPAIGS